ncbi:Ras, Miro, and/or Arf domain containing protein [Asbolus verrucosus]|uniref:Ras, Miro, and/or Arf domain containing protein n=1 Tax=Asbolus verrucosus TaxID=1661398 RepID=A0A482WBV4_ASBVE|nr:Ras, Miro, and/or Arf domain containing protein [Asbolus verrucosus]
MCGKTCLIKTFISGEFEENFVPTLFDTYETKIEVDGRTISLNIFDTAASETYDRLIPLYYPATDVFLVCFAIDLPASFESIEHRWIPEIRSHCPGIPILLVGNRSDLRDDECSLEYLKKRGKKPISTIQARALARKIGAVDYIECSAKRKENVEHVFLTAMKEAEKKAGRSKCTVM